MADTIECGGESDSSENEELARLKEAVNHEFINDSMFNKDLKDKNRLEKNGCVDSLQSAPLSLRHQEHQNNYLRVTPEFQNFVSKHLVQLIDSQLKEKRSKRSVKPKQDPTGGVKLFSDSTEYLSLTSQTETSTCSAKTKSMKRKKDSSSDSEEERSRFSEAAVTSDWILGQESTKGWNKSCKGKEIIVNSKGSIVHEKN